MPTWKKIILLIVMLLTAAYLVMAFLFINSKPRGVVCEGIEVKVKGTDYPDILSKKSIESILASKRLNPKGKNIDSINIHAIEQELSHLSLIDNVECYKTPSGKLAVDIICRKPILRVMAANGENYYIDEKGKAMPLLHGGHTFYLPIVTGYVEKSFSTEKLHNFGLFLQKDHFWNSQIEQINVLVGNKIELIPRVGDNIIYLGTIDNYEEKLNRVRRFYTEALNKIGWNKYSRINVEYGNQIICTKKKH